jgi:hypothetical protein
MAQWMLPAVSAIAGGATEVAAPGNPAGLAMMGAGIGGLGGNAIGGLPGMGVGSALGGMAGGFGGMAMPGMGTSGSASPAAMASALASNPSLSGINPSMVTGMSGGNSSGAMPTQAGLMQQLMNDPNQDPLTKMMMLQMLQNQPSKLAAVMGGLSPLGNTLLAANILPKQIAPQAAATHGGATGPGPLPFVPPGQPMQPLQTAQLIAALI